MNDRETIDLEQGWEFIQRGITKLKNHLEGLPEAQINSEDYMTFYTMIFKMCTQKPPHDYSQQLYDKYRESLEEYITSMVLPSLREKDDAFRMRELVDRLANYKVMVRWLSRWFHYLDRYFIARRSLPALNEVGLTCFRDLAFKEAFKVFCNKGVGGSSSAELLATFCDNILKKGGIEKLSDEAIEETLDKKVEKKRHRCLISVLANGATSTKEADPVSQPQVAQLLGHC